MTFLLCVAIGFNYVFQYPPTPNSKPSTKDLVGTWALTDKSQEELLKLGKLASTNQIIIKEDGSCVLIQVPSLIVSSKGYDVNFLSGRGVWLLEQDANEDDLIDLSVILDGGTKSDYIIMFISGNKPPFTLFQNLFGKLPNWTYSRAF
jgi:hypothetical protein